MLMIFFLFFFVFFFQAEDGIRDHCVTGVQTCALPISQPIKDSRYAKIQVKDLENKLKLKEKDENFSQILRIGAYVKDDVRDLLDLRMELMGNLFTTVATRMDRSEERRVGKECRARWGRGAERDREWRRGGEGW